MLAVEVPVCHPIQPMRTLSLRAFLGLLLALLCVVSLCATGMVAHETECEDHCDSSLCLCTCCCMPIETAGSRTAAADADPTRVPLLLQRPASPLLSPDIFRPPAAVVLPA